MHKSLTHLLIIGVLTAMAATTIIRSQAGEKMASTEAGEKQRRPSNIPFHGKLHSVDKPSQTITLEGKEKKRTIQVTAQTRIMKAGKAATLEDAVIGEEIGGQITKNGEGKEEAVSLRFGPKPEEKPKERKKAKGEGK